MIFTAILRTVIPALWGNLIAWLIGVVPLLVPFEDELRGYGAFIASVVTALIIGAWYAFWRWLQPRLPDWAVRAVLGSSKTPVYAGKHAATTAPDAAPEARQGTLERPGL